MNIRQLKRRLLCPSCGKVGDLGQDKRQTTPIAASNAAATKRKTI
jgi:hypothetical protein